MRLKLILAAVATAVSVSASASVTSLVTIPIADILGHREAELNWDLSGTESRIDKRWYHTLGITVGMLDKMELSFDNDLAGTSTFHAKLGLLEREGKVPYAVSAGIANYEGRGHADAFVASRFDFSGFRVHAGWLRDDTDRLILGVDFPVLTDWSGAVEYTSGPHGYAWAALSAPVKAVDGLYVTGSVGFPATRADGNQYCVSLTYGFRF